MSDSTKPIEANDFKAEGLPEKTPDIEQAPVLTHSMLIKLVAFCLAYAGFGVISWNELISKDHPLTIDVLEKVNLSLGARDLSRVVPDIDRLVEILRLATWACCGLVLSFHTFLLTIGELTSLNFYKNTKSIVIAALLPALFAPGILIAYAAYEVENFTGPPELLLAVIHQCESRFTLYSALLIAINISCGCYHFFIRKMIAGTKQLIGLV